jgi:hypothetical protein
VSKSSPQLNEENIDDLQFIDNKSNSESAFWRLKKASDERRDFRINKILAQENESLFTTLGRMLYISSCMLFDILVLGEIILYFENYYTGVLIFGAILTLAILIQKNIYGRLFSIQIEIDRYR